MLSGCGSRARSELKGKHFILFFPSKYLHIRQAYEKNQLALCLCYIIAHSEFRTSKRIPPLLIKVSPSRIRYRLCCRLSLLTLEVAYDPRQAQVK